MSEKQKEALEKLGEATQNLSDAELEKVLYIGQGMAMMRDIMESEKKEIDLAE